VLATVGPFRLDRFEVTVGRFRKFIAAGSPEPAPGAGKHGFLSGGPETGWDDAWSIPTTVAEWDTELACNVLWHVWTPAEGANENKAINCLDWYAAYAFCIWDGGFLPTEAEWELAASGGEERVFPWSKSTDSAITPDHAVYWQTALSYVGAKSPAGDGRWGHADLAGGVWEWTLDTYVEQFPHSPCNDCVNQSSMLTRVIRGGGFNNPESLQRAAYRDGQDTTIVPSGVGVRCARLGG
jgi:formylglycine-generating enzyme required for sulfatase activity